MLSRMIPVRPVPTDKELQIGLNYTKSSTTLLPPSFHSKICIKPWGYEFIAFESKKIGIWILTVMEGHKTSMHCHFKKDTWILVLKGCAKIELVDGTRCLYPMDLMLIPKHKFHSIGTFAPSTTILEMEVFDEDVTCSDKNDLLRVDDQYHRKPVGYESSVQIESVSLDQYNHFSFHSQKEVKTLSAHLQVKSLTSKEDINALQEFQHVFLLNGVCSTNFLYLKEGSLLDSQILSSLVLPQQNDSAIEVLAIKKIDWKEDHKIIYNKEHLNAVVKTLKQADEKIVLTSGCFDILHVGHIHTLKTAKQLGTKLIVCLSSDEQIQQLKGSGRPINNNDDRLNLFKIIEYVDYIYPYQEENIQEEQTLGSIMKTVDPDVWVKGSDYTKEAILAKHPYLRKIAIVDLVENKSTTNIIKKISDST